MRVAVCEGMVLMPLRELEEVVTDELGQAHRVTVVGVPRQDGRWDGFLAFRGDEGAVHVTGRETTTRDAGALFAWAAGLSSVDLAAALERATGDAAGVARWWSRSVGLA